jgi:hypothetical protein
MRTVFTKEPAEAIRVAQDETVIAARAELGAIRTRLEAAITLRDQLECSVVTEPHPVRQRRMIREITDVRDRIHDLEETHRTAAQALSNATAATRVGCSPITPPSVAIF